MTNAHLTAIQNQQAHDQGYFIFFVEYLFVLPLTTESPDSLKISTSRKTGSRYLLPLCSS